MKFAVNELTKSASRALSALYTKFLNVGGMDYDVFVSFMNRWSSQCCFMVQVCGDYLNRKK